ncbi:VWA domain-containing protein [Methylomonas sp. EFPC1]|uniref:VWA domain-containing protein n=1 Tax=Methylomonas sp. EFPC1 TaxID=2812647 RepID=UPI001966EDCC|nr:VWA domain-containing protein [Methylomonas sp. EFPC1]QSA99817.1 VWA domain-containing protein [Methylomonas sp. EFPC1]
MASNLEQRWRLVLGRFANKHLGSVPLNKQQSQQDQVLEQLYKKQLERRGLRTSGTLDDSRLQVVDWLHQADRLFPKTVREKIQGHAVHEFGIKELLKNKDCLSNLTPNMALLKQLLAVRAELSPELMQEVRRIIQTVVDELLQQLQPKFNQTFSGRLNRHQNSPQPVLANLDWAKTIRRNLKYYDRQRQCLLPQTIYFSSRSQKHLPWRVILCLDQSGSMMDSVIYSAVIAGILARLPCVDLKLVLFDTNVVDLSAKAHDPVEVLLSSQMCGGTHIAKAWSYCQQLAEQPRRTVIVTISDFEEGASPSALLLQAAQMLESGIKMLGITAMAADATPFYDLATTSKLGQLGMEIASLSPDVFADWLAKAMEL